MLLFCVVLSLQIYKHLKNTTQIIDNQYFNNPKQIQKLYPKWRIWVKMDEVDGKKDKIDAAASEEVKGCNSP